MPVGVLAELVVSCMVALIVVDARGDNVVDAGITVVVVTSLPVELELIDSDEVPTLAECELSPV